MRDIVGQYLMILVYARVSTVSQSVVAGAEKVWREMAGLAKADRAQPCRIRARSDPRLDTRDAHAPLRTASSSAWSLSSPRQSSASFVRQDNICILPPRSWNRTFNDLRSSATLHRREI